MKDTSQLLMTRFQILLRQDACNKYVTFFKMCLKSAPCKKSFFIYTVSLCW